MPSDTEMRSWILLLLVLLWGWLGYAACEALFDWPPFFAQPWGKWLSLGGLAALAVLPTRIAWTLLRRRDS